VTQTRQGIANRYVLAYLPEAHSIAGLSRQILDARRPVGRDSTPAEKEAEGLIQYAPNIEIDPRSIISHQRNVLGVKNILATPVIVESTTLIVAYGVDVFGTRLAPSGMFDILGDGFNKPTLILTVVSLLAGVLFLSPMVRKSLSLSHSRHFANTALGEEKTDQQRLGELEEVKREGMSY